jgi:hypothetical protein
MTKRTWIVVASCLVVFVVVLRLRGNPNAEDFPNTGDFQLAKDECGKWVKDRYLPGMRDEDIRRLIRECPYLKKFNVVVPEPEKTPSSGECVALKAELERNPDLRYDGGPIHDKFRWCNLI